MPAQTAPKSHTAMFGRRPHGRRLGATNAAAQGAAPHYAAVIAAPAVTPTATPTSAAIR
jgi:hypothetical protein